LTVNRETNLLSRQCLSNKNENAIVLKSKNFLCLGLTCYWGRRNRAGTSAYWRRASKADSALKPAAIHRDASFRMVCSTSAGCRGVPSKVHAFRSFHKFHPTRKNVVSQVLLSASFVLWSCCFVLWNWFCWSEHGWTLCSLICFRHYSLRWIN